MSVGKIEAVDIVGDRRIAIRMDDGSRCIVDLSSLIATRSILAPLRDRHEFSQLQISTDGWSLEWPSGIDFGAPQLQRWAEEQIARTPPNPVDA